MCAHAYYSLYNRDYRIAGKFGGFAIYITTTKLKSSKISYLHINYYTYGDPVLNRQI